MPLPTSAEKQAMLDAKRIEINQANLALIEAQNALTARQAEYDALMALETYDEPPPPPPGPTGAPEGLRLDEFGLTWDRQQVEGVYVEGYEVHESTPEGTEPNIVYGTLTFSNDNQFVHYRGLSQNYDPATRVARVRALPFTLPDGRQVPTGYWSELGVQNP